MVRSVSYTHLDVYKRQVESYYKDGCALFTVTVEDEKRLEAVAAVRELIGEGNALEGAAEMCIRDSSMPRPFWAASSAATPPIRWNSTRTCLLYTSRCV